MITAMRDAVASQLIGRDREAALLTLALIAREHVLLVGPPGTAKSHLCRTTAGVVSDARYSERLLSPTTAPEEVFGPYDIAALRAVPSRYERVRDGSITDSHIVYLDEVGRASPAILDTMLHLLGPERQALIGTQQVKAPLISAIGSANTWPEDPAMLDRWLLRASVQYLPHSMRRDLLTFTAPALVPVCSVADLDAAHMASRAITWSQEAFDTLDLILADLDEAGIAISDRRLRASDKIARAAAFMRGSTKVEAIDLEPLQFVLWSVPEQAATAAQKVVTRANPIGAKLDAMLAEADELGRSALDSGSRLDAAQKLDALLKEAKQVAAQPGANGRAAKVVKFIKREHMRVKGAILGLSAEKIEMMFAED